MKLVPFFLVVSGVLWGQGAVGNSAEIKVETFTYKQVGDLAIQLDVHRPDDNRLRPVTVWLHGGALINGGRQGIGRAGKMLLDAGYCVVSIDYRLAPETKAPEIYRDVEDAFRWIRENAREKFHGDPSKIAVLGGSAGGHLALTTGFRIEPRPACLVSFWGYGDLIGPWMSEPSPHHGLRIKTLNDAEMVAVEAGPPVANQADRVGEGSAYYHTCRKRGIWPLKVVGYDPKSEPEKFFPFMAAKNVTPEYPPTLMIHGTIDTDVPFEQSVIMAREFERCGVEHELVRIENGEHGLAGAAPEDIEAAYAKVLPFIVKFVPPPVSD